MERGEGKDKELTRMRCVSGFSLEVMWSAMLVWKREERATKRAAVGWSDIGGAIWQNPTLFGEGSLLK
jgi:hypothetical protein